MARLDHGGGYDRSGSGYVRGGLSTNSRGKADVTFGRQSNLAFRLRPTSYQIGFQSSAFFPGRPRTCWSVIGGRNENRADGPTGSICCFTPVLPTEGGRRQEGKGSSSPSRTKSEPGKAWSSLPT